MGGAPIIVSGMSSNAIACTIRFTCGVFWRYSLGHVPFSSPPHASKDRINGFFRKDHR